MGRTYTDAKARIAELEKAEEVMSTNNESLMKRCENYMDAKAEIERLTALVPKWISVDSGFPKETPLMVLTCEDIQLIGIYHCGYSNWRDVFGRELQHISQWAYPPIIPLPPAPEASDASPNS